MKVSWRSGSTDQYIGTITMQKAAKLMPSSKKVQAYKWLYNSFYPQKSRISESTKPVNSK